MAGVVNKPSCLHTCRKPSAKMCHTCECRACKACSIKGRRLHASPERTDAAFTFGYDYTHFLYALSPVPPHRLLGSSAEFCLASAQDPHDCESVQFVSGLVVSGDTLLVAYGVNDCESKIGRLPIARAWEMLSQGAKGGRLKCS